MRGRAGDLVLAASVHFCTFAAERNLVSFTYGEKTKTRFGLLVTVYKNRIHARRAAVALLKMARTTSDPDIAAGLVDVAASLKEEAGELPPTVSIVPPDVATDAPPDVTEG
jgi:hypothetical protein